MIIYCTPFRRGCKMKICDATIRINDGGGTAPHLAGPPKEGGTPPSARWARHFPRRRGKLLCRYSPKPPPYDGGGGPLAVVGAR